MSSETFPRMLAWSGSLLVIVPLIRPSSDARLVLRLNQCSMFQRCFSRQLPSAVALRAGLLAALRSCVAHGEDWAEPPCTGRRSSTVDGWLVADKNSLTTQQVSWRGAVRREPSGPPQVVVLLSCRTRRSISIASPKITYIF